MKKFIVELVSDVDYEGMVVEVSFENFILARLNYDKGVDNIEMEIPSNSSHSIIFPLDGYLECIEKAKEILIRCYNEDQRKHSDREN